MFLLMMGLDDTSRLNDVLQAWQTAGVRGVTILESTGMQRVIERHKPSAARGGFGGLFGGMVGHKTIFAVVDDLEMAEAAMRQAELVVGSLSEPSTGIAFLVPVMAAWGITPS